MIGWPYTLRMRHAAFAILVTLFIVWVGQNWSHYSGALMIAAWIRYDGRLDARIF